jgi:hypothetical protein
MPKDKLTIAPNYEFHLPPYKCDGLKDHVKLAQVGEERRAPAKARLAGLG